MSRDEMLQLTQKCVYKQCLTVGSSRTGTFAKVVGQETGTAEKWNRIVSADKAAGLAEYLSL